MLFRLSELRQQKQKLSRQVRDKEEEHETALQKIDSLRQDIRKAEKLRRELELKVEDATNEATKERKMREKLEKESSGPLKSPGLGHMGGDAEAHRLRAEIERQELATQETVISLQSKHSTEIAALREHLEESERRNQALELDMQAMREKVDRARLDSLQESEETMNEMRNVYEREKSMLTDENKKLQVELERSVDMNGRLHLERRQIEDEYAELKTKKEAIAQWESQISEIISWVSDEKDARGYLQALAARMTDELEGLKLSGSGASGNGLAVGQSSAEKNWKNRRSQKLEKMELLNLQSNLQSEIHAKQAITEELSKVRSELEAARM